MKTLSNHVNPKKLKEGDVLYDVLFGEVTVTKILSSNSQFTKHYEQLVCQGNLSSGGTVEYSYSLSGYQQQFNNFPRLYKSNPFINKL